MKTVLALAIALFLVTELHACHRGRGNASQQPQQAPATYYYVQPQQQQPQPQPTVYYYQPQSYQQVQPFQGQVGNCPGGNCGAPGRGFFRR